ncbi:uncharacterized protein At3g28850-like isoform X2 [Prosopis cineraria]|uniref:uncharacterized protein At3g28850-like isoform X2 n=1 Tax=Prosopis cineraria TaxID=364024 RepID=UPI0024109121|nr:uncharacterized protein At3g28850-like isoform X2 [Prosopis cineraria]
MGCASSKQKRCRHCNAPYSPVPRSYSMHVHHPPQKEGDSNHVVALTSTTLGSLKLDSPLSSYQKTHRLPEIGGQNGFKFSHSKVSDSDGFSFDNRDSIDDDKKKKNEDLSASQRKIKEFSMGLIEAKTWSNMIDEKLPKYMPRTPIRTPPGEPETINAWELMEGLEDISPFRSPNHFRSFSFDQSVSAPTDPPRSGLVQDGTRSSKPLWLQMSEDELSPRIPPAITDFDPEVISSFRESLQELSPEIPFQLRLIDDEKNHSITANNLSFDVTEENTIEGNDMDLKTLPFNKDKVVLYFTTLRGVRKTFEDCCHVRLILKGLGVRVDERDVSMHSGFKDELKELLGDKLTGIGLPVVFIGTKPIGGAEEIQKLHEDGKLEKLLNCCERVGDERGGNSDICEACGDIRFVPCETCSGSCKIYLEAEEEDEDGEVGDYGFQRCPDCNENGLIRCPLCCS